MEYITIDCDRYFGSYSGATYTAWVGKKPEEIDSGDGTCQYFWDECTPPPHGKGETEQDALLDLLANTNRWIGEFDLVDRGDEHHADDRFIPVWSERFPLIFPLALADRDS
jgi:hypothetical protein